MSIISTNGQSQNAEAAPVEQIMEAPPFPNGNTNHGFTNGPLFPADDTTAQANSIGSPLSNGHVGSNEMNGSIAAANSTHEHANGAANGTTTDANGTTDGITAHTNGTNGTAAPTDADLRLANGALPLDTTPSPTTTTAHPFPTLAGKVALVTGASRGIGAGIALELGSRGCAVVVNYHKGLPAAQRIVSQIQAMGSRAIAIQADVSHVSEITRLFTTAKSAMGKLDIVCSNSGMESFDRTADITEQRFDLVFGLNFRAQFFVAQHAYTHLEPGGRVILMSSIAAGLIGVADHALYSSSKMAINGVTKSFAKDFGHRGITVNAIAPGGVKSDMFTQVAWKYIPGATGEWPAEQIESEMAMVCPLGRCAVPKDIARVVAFLAGEDAGWVTGESFFWFYVRTGKLIAWTGQVITISGGSGQ